MMTWDRLQEMYLPAPGPTLYSVSASHLQDSSFFPLLSSLLNLLTDILYIKYRSNVDIDNSADHGLSTIIKWAMIPSHDFTCDSPPAGADLPSCVEPAHPLVRELPYDRLTLRFPFNYYIPFFNFYNLSML